MLYPVEKKETSGHRTSALRERVKELECLYAIARASAQPNLKPAEFLLRVADILPAALRFPALAYASITYDGRPYSTSAKTEATDPHLDAPITVQGMMRGNVIVGYPPGSFSASPFLDEERRLLSEVARQIGQILDGLEAKEAQEALRDQLRHMERLVTIGQLASGMAHELNEPLGSILGFSQLLAKDPGMPDHARKDLSRIETATLHARDIIRKIIVFARDSAPTLEPVDLHHLVKECGDLLMWRCEDAGVDVRFELEPYFPVLQADKSLIRQVIINLVVNAIQAMPDGGRLTLSTARIPQGAQLSVTDTGLGISAENLPRIFDPFFTTKDVGQGTGLGLSVVHGIVTAHQAEIRVNSIPQHGTSVHICFSKTGETPRPAGTQQTGRRTDGG